MKPSLEELLPRPSVMGVVNVTPDSFSDGGAFLRPEAADRAGARDARRRRGDRRRRRRVDPARLRGRLGRGGARPRRARPRARSSDVPVSDRHLEGRGRAPGARRRARCSSTTSPRSAATPSSRASSPTSGAYLCLMHMLGEPRTMQDDPRYDDVVSEVKAFLEERLAFAVEAGIPEERICLDPGIGFGKTVEHNLELLARLDEIVALGRPGARRRLAQALPRPAPRRREALTGPVSAGVARRRARLRARCVDLPRPRRARARRGARRRARARGGALMSQVEIEIDGLELIGFHGATRGGAARPASASSSTSGSSPTTRAFAATSSTTRSTTRRSSPASARSRTRAGST